MKTKFTDFSANDARAERSSKGDVNRETYKMIYCSILNTIRTSVSSGYTCTLFKIPGYILGRPKINTKHAMRYCRDKLVLNGYKVVEKCDDGVYSLYIDWKPVVKETVMIKKNNAPPPMDIASVLKRRGITGALSKK